MASHGGTWQNYTAFTTAQARPRAAKPLHMALSLMVTHRTQGTNRRVLIKSHSPHQNPRDRRHGWASVRERRDVFGLAKGL